MSDIKVGDCVLVKQQKRNKLTSYFNEIPYTVTRRHHSRITAQNKNGHTITRNISHFKPIQIDNTNDTDDDNEYPVVDTNKNNKNNNNNNNNTNNNSTNNNHNNNAHEPIARRSSRNTRRPERYGHPITWTLNSKKGK